MTKSFFGAFTVLTAGLSTLVQGEQSRSPRHSTLAAAVSRTAALSVPGCGSVHLQHFHASRRAMAFKAGQWRPQKHLDKKREKIVVTFIQATVRRFSSSLSFARKHKLGERLKSSCSFCLWIQVLLEQQPKVRSSAAGPYPRRHSHRSPSPKVRTLVLPPRPIWQRHVAAAPVL